MKTMPLVERVQCLFSFTHHFFFISESSIKFASDGKGTYVVERTSEAFQTKVCIDQK